MAVRRDREVVRITDARGSLSDDIARRRRNYLISMSIRVLCFVGAYFAHGWLRWTCVAGALVIPYVAVVLANAATTLVASPPLPPMDTTTPRIGTAAAPDGAATSTRDGRTVDGQWASQTSGSLVHDRTSSGS